MWLVMSVFVLPLSLSLFFFHSLYFRFFSSTISKHFILFWWHTAIWRYQIYTYICYTQTASNRILYGTRFICIISSTRFLKKKMYWQQQLQRKSHHCTVLNHIKHNNFKSPTQGIVCISYYSFFMINFFSFFFYLSF